MGIWSLVRRDRSSQDTARTALKDARHSGETEDGSGGAVRRTVETIRDLGIDGTLGYASAATVASRARRGRGKRRTATAERRIVRRHRRGVTVGGFLTGLGGFVTLPVLLPANVLEFSVQATRMVAAIADVRGYDLEDPEIRTRVLATLLGEESGDLLGSIGLGPVAGVAGREVAKRVPSSFTGDVLAAVGSRLLRRFALRSARLFGKAIPGLGAVLGALSDRRALRGVVAAARTGFPDRSGS